jgi:SAM-dependent methyltransferase
LNTLLHPDDDLLDIGAGTGRFALPLAHYVRRVTALDHSPAMLSVLQHKMRSSETHNIDLVCDAWETANVAPHDVVLAAWSLYRQPSLLQALHKMVLSTRRLLLIVAEVKSYPPHRTASEMLWPQRYQQEIDVPMHLCFLGALWQLGIHADMNIVHETRLFQAATRQQLAALLMPDTASQEDMDQLAREMGTHIKKQKGGYCYNCTEPVALISWVANE